MFWSKIWLGYWFIQAHLPPSYTWILPSITDSVSDTQTSSQRIPSSKLRAEGAKATYSSEKLRALHHTLASCLQAQLAAENNFVITCNQSALMRTSPRENKHKAQCCVAEVLLWYSQLHVPLTQCFPPSDLKGADLLAIWSCKGLLPTPQSQNEINRLGGTSEKSNQWQRDWRSWFIN